MPAATRNCGLAITSSVAAPIDRTVIVVAWMTVMKKPGIPLVRFSSASPNR